MPTIKISDAVWAVIEKHGKFKETEDDVLRRLLNICGSEKEKPVEARGWKERRAEVRMTQNDCQNNELVLRFDSGAMFREKLPAKSDISAIRRIRDAAVEFVKKIMALQGRNTQRYEH